LSDETDAEKSSTLALNTTNNSTKPGELVNSTEVREDMGNGTFRVRRTKVFRRRVQGYRRANARQPDNDGMSVPDVENRKAPKDKIVDDKVVPIE
jgi:hypothetical protein